MKNKLFLSFFLCASLFAKDIAYDYATQLNTQLALANDELSKEEIALQLDYDYYKCEMQNSQIFCKNPLVKLLSNGQELVSFSAISHRTNFFASEPKKYTFSELFKQLPAVFGESDKVAKITLSEMVKGLAAFAVLNDERFSFLPIIANKDYTYKQNVLVQKGEKNQLNFTAFLGSIDDEISLKIDANIAVSPEAIAKLDDYAFIDGKKQSIEPSKKGKEISEKKDEELDQALSAIFEEFSPYLYLKNIHAQFVLNSDELLKNLADVIEDERFAELKNDLLKNHSITLEISYAGDENLSNMQPEKLKILLNGKAFDPRML